MPLKGVEQTIPLGRQSSPPPARQASFPNTFDEQSHHVVQNVYGQPARSAAIPLRTQTPPRVVSQQRQGAYVIDQYDGPTTAVRDQAGPQRVHSEPRKTTKTVKEGQRLSTPSASRNSGVSGAGLKVAVKNTLPTTQNRGALGYKHETSQTTDDSVHESDLDSDFGRENQPRGGQQRVAFAAEHRHQGSTASSRSNDSTLFNAQGYKDEHNDHPRHDQADPTAIFRPANVSHDAQPPLNRKVKSVAQQQPTAGSKRQPNQDFTLFRDKAHKAEEHDAAINRQYDQNADDSTSLFDERDPDLMRPHGSRHDETPSKSATQQHVKNESRATRKPVAGKQQMYSRSERSSSPLVEDFDDPEPTQVIPESNLADYRRYGQEHLGEYRRDQELREHEAQLIQMPTAAKVPESIEVSEDDRPVLAAPPAQKRPFEQVDYEDQDLRTMEYADLDKVTFLQDPRVRPPEPAVHENGAPMTLEDRLSKLSQMKTDDQKSFFRSLTDAENEQAGLWFVESFGNDLKQLMETRLQRRKVALKYELEAKERQKAVETKEADIESELKELRQGGGSLLQGRSSPRPTPR